MKIAICKSCKDPLKMWYDYAKFMCMCDEEIRTIHLNDLDNHTHVTYLNIEDLAEPIPQNFL